MVEWLIHFYWWRNQCDDILFDIVEYAQVQRNVSWIRAADLR